MSIKNDILDGTITGSSVEDPTLNLADGAKVKEVPNHIYSKDWREIFKPLKIAGKMK